MNITTPAKHIVIVDPGLREFGGHHPALLETLAESTALIEAGIKVTVFANQAVSIESVQSLSKGCISVVPFFYTDFYMHFYEEKKLPYYNGYIQALTKEYLSLFSDLEGNDVVFLHHTLHWEHAYALSLAIRLHKQHGGAVLPHLVCLMFNPCVYTIDQQLKTSRYFAFSLGFSALQRLDNVTLFAAEYELKQHYQAMLHSPIASHPCGLLSAQHSADITQCKSALNKKSQQSQDILLFIGDAKDNKGFLELPELVTTLTQSILDPAIRFVIQYTLTNDRKDLVAVDRALKALQQEDNRILLYPYFLDNQAMHQLWLRVGYTVLNYQPQAYQYQSSGVLWLAAAYQTKIYLMTKTWLNREAHRLNCTANEVSTLAQLAQALAAEINNKSNAGKATQVNHDSPVTQVDSEPNYNTYLFSDFGEWLVTQIRQLTCQQT